MKIPQFNLGPWFGALRLQAQNAQFYVAAVQIFLVSIAAIRTIQEWAPWFTFPMLVAGLVVLYLGAIIFEHVFVYKSVIHYTTSQSWIEENPAVRKLRDIEEKIAEITKKLERIENHENTPRN